MHIKYKIKRILASVIFKTHRVRLVMSSILYPRCALLLNLVVIISMLCLYLYLPVIHYPASYNSYTNQTGFISNLCTHANHPQTKTQPQTDQTRPHNNAGHTNNTHPTRHQIVSIPSIRPVATCAGAAARQADAPRRRAPAELARGAVAVAVTVPIVGPIVGPQHAGQQMGPTAG